ncbi:hypothetical protein DTO012A7_9442 [Penicillium roqueforti]|nr:hypothetical protein LCP963914a_6154 [Penicillium roqueforti]KAI3220596.1 hypothetical protein DTO012A7_9442 [Penicillium roqueforti]
MSITYIGRDGTTDSPTTTAASVTTNATAKVAITKGTSAIIKAASSETTIKAPTQITEATSSATTIKAISQTTEPTAKATSRSVAAIGSRFRNPSSSSVIKVAKAITSSAASSIMDVIASGPDSELPATTAIYTPDTPSRPSRVPTVSEVPTDAQSAIPSSVISVIPSGTPTRIARGHRRKHSHS